jgi:hypothetical protein
MYLPVTGKNIADDSLIDDQILPVCDEKIMLLNNADTKEETLDHLSYYVKKYTNLN